MQPQTIPVISVTGRSSATGLALLQAYRIAIADDDETFLLLVRHSVSRAFPNATIATFSNAGDALMHILKTGTDILITDHGMGALSGTDLILELRARGLTIPIVMVSSTPDAEQEALLAGATEFIEKSVSFAGIVDRLRRLLTARSFAHHSAVTSCAAAGAASR